MAARERQHVERLLVIGLRAHAAVEARHGLHVVIEHVRTRIQHARHRIEIAAKIGRQHFDPRFRQRAAHLAHGLGEMVRAAVFQIVAVDAGDNHVAQVKASRHARDISRLGRVEPHVVLARVGLSAPNRSRSRACSRFPRIMNVAAPRWKHSWILGQRADSQTVCRLSWRNPALEPVQGFEMRAALARPFGQRGRGARPSICTKASDVTVCASPGAVPHFPVAS